MSDPSDFESIISDVIVSPCSSLDETGSSGSKSTKNNNCINIVVDDPRDSNPDPCGDASFTDSDHSLLEAPKLFNASSPSSVCSTRPLEWDSGADVGYDITTKQQSQDMSTIERIAVSNLVLNANSTPNYYAIRIGTRVKSNSLIDLNETGSSEKPKSASLEALKFTAVKSDTLPKCRSPMASSLSVSTVVVRKSDTLKDESFRKRNDGNERGKRVGKLMINSNVEKSSDSSKESNSTLGSADTAGSWMAKEFFDSTNTTTTDRVNSFEYLPGNAYYDGGRDNNLEDESDKEIKQSTKILVDAMKRNGLTDEFQRKELFKEIIESFLRHNVPKDNDLSTTKSTPDTDQTPARQDFTSQTSNTGNTVVHNQTNNQSSTITFTSPITSSRYGDDVDSKYDESSMDSGRHMDLEKCKSYKLIKTKGKQKNQGVQCTLQDSLTNICVSGKSKQSTKFTKPNAFKTNEGNSEPSSKNDVPRFKCKDITQDVHKEFKKQMIWFHTSYMKKEKENQMLWINNQISHLNNLKKLLSTHEELKKNWNSYKQKPTINNKLKFRKSLPPVSNSSSNCTSTTKTDSSTTTKTDSTISSKQYSTTSKYDTTDCESSTTVCDHVHYKKGIKVDEPMSMKRCCDKTLHRIEEKHLQNYNKLKNVGSQTETIKETKFKNSQKGSTQSGETYTVEHKFKSVNRKSSISYDIIFKPTSKSLKKINCVNNKSKQQNQSISVACQTNGVQFELKPSLQEYLTSNRPDYVCRAEKRQNILSDLANLREERRNVKKNILINSCENKIPPNPLTVKRVMSQKEMRKQTERKYRKCPEVINKKIEIKRKEEFKTNKIMANIFNKRLQRKTLKGNVDLSNSVSVCSL